MPINLQELTAGQLSTRSNRLVEGAFPAAYLAFGDASAALVLKMNLLVGMTQKRIQSTSKVKNFETQINQIEMRKQKVFLSRISKCHQNLAVGTPS